MCGTGEAAPFVLVIGNIASPLNYGWLIDSGATQNMVKNESLPDDFVVKAADCKPISGVGEGSIRRIKLEGGEMLVNFEKDLHVSDLADNLLLVCYLVLLRSCRLRP